MGVLAYAVSDLIGALLTSDRGARDEDILRHECVDFEVVPMTPALVRRALELHRLCQIHFWDAQILAAAEASNCAVLFSEDLNPGPLYAAVRVENPFVASP